MGKIPPNVATSAEREKIISLGFPPLYQGKVGELFEVPNHPDQLLMHRSNRLSIFDFVLPCTVDFKGEVLIALTHFWLTRVFDVEHHMLAWGMNPELWGQSGWEDMDLVAKLPLASTILIRREEVSPHEMIYRGHIGGSVWNEYVEHGTANGQPLAAGLTKWSKIDPIFTPTTKSADGHDKKETVESYLTQTGDEGRRTMRIDRVLYKIAYRRAAKKRILILDTKFENSTTGRLLDEVLTPDSSRFTTEEDLALALEQGRDPVFYDKEPVRSWGKKIETPWGTGLHNKNMDPENPDHLALVAGLEVPEEVTSETTQRYLEIFRMLTGMELAAYQSEMMDVPKAA